MADALPQLVWTTDIDGNTEFFNARWYEYTGQTPDKACGSGWKEVVHPDDLFASAQLWEEAVATGLQYEVEYRLRCGSDGSYRWFLARGLPQLDDDGAVVSWFGTCTDIHDQKLASEVLRKAKETADRDARAKDEFLAILSHELRTPLSAILGWTQLLEMGVLDVTETSDALQTIKHQAKLQSQLIEDLLDVSRMINGKLCVRPQVIHVARVVRMAIDMVKPAALEKKLQLVVEESDLSLAVNADPQRLQQVISNLLFNAVKFTPPEGRIVIRTMRDNGDACVTITDTGTGIPADQLQSIFNRFHQLNTTNSRSQTGLGLGLSIARHIVDLHHGRISASSPGEGAGSTFSVWLPLAAVTTTDTHDPVTNTDIPVADALVARTVLVVDDNTAARVVVSACLQQFGATVHQADSVASAWDALQLTSFDAVISDIAMPHENGNDLVRRVRASNALAHMPMVALTAFASLDDQNRALAAGFDAHISKPVEPVNLVRQVYRVLDVTRKSNCRADSQHSSVV